MPELPEVETMRRGIASIVGSRIEDVRIPPSALRPITIDPPIDEFRRRIVGRTMVSVGRLGKRIVIELDSGERIVIEPRMTGRVLLKQPPDAKHLRLVIALSRTAQLLFWDSRGLGVVRLLTREDLARRLGPAKLGPDALEVTAEQLRVRLHTSRRPIKVAMLDQSALAGVGNLYASEILHRARLHPAAPCNRIRRAGWQRIHAAMQEILNEAVSRQGSTLSDGTYRNVQNETGRYQEQHRVYQRDGKLCQQCGKARIVRIVQAQRSSFFCPNCQRLGR